LRLKLEKERETELSSRLWFSGEEKATRGFKSNTTKIEERKKK